MLRVFFNIQCLYKYFWDIILLKCVLLYWWLSAVGSKLWIVDDRGGKKGNFYTSFSMCEMKSSEKAITTLVTSD